MARPIFLLALYAAVIHVFASGATEELGFMLLAGVAEL